MLAEAIEEAYSDLFNLKRDAQNMDTADVRGKFKSLTQGQKSDNVISNMAATFTALCEQADWSKPEREESKRTEKSEHAKESKPSSKEKDAKVAAEGIEGAAKLGKLQLHYNIQLILPNSRDPAVYDALFTSLKRHLL